MAVFTAVHERQVAMGLEQVVDPVLYFAKGADRVLPKVPTPPSAEMKARLRRFLTEEGLTELMTAIDTEDMVEIVDGSCDLLFVLIGALLEMGVGTMIFGKSMGIVCRKNAEKIDPQTGKAYIIKDGKVQKPPGWVSPNGEIKAILEAAAKAA